MTDKPKPFAESWDDESLDLFKTNLEIEGYDGEVIVEVIHALRHHDALCKRDESLTRIEEFINRREDELELEIVAESLAGNTYKRDMAEHAYAEIRLIRAALKGKDNG